MLEVDAERKRRDIGRYSQPFFWFLWTTIVLVAAAFYYPKAADQRSAFVRWQPQVLQFWEGVNIYDKMYFPNPPIMPITLYPLMTLPPVAAAMSWFLIKAGMTTIVLLICFNVVKPAGKPMPPFFQTAILLLALRPILGDLHHGNINLVILFLVALMYEAWRRGWNIRAGLLLSLAIAFKVTPALFVPYFAYKRSWRTVGATFLGLALFLLVVPTMVLGWEFNHLCLTTWWDRMLTPFLVEGNASPQEPNQSMVGVLTRLLTEIEPGTNRYDVRHDLNLLALSPVFVANLIKGVSVALVALLAYFCRTKVADRRSPLYLGEVSLVVLTMLFMSERSWKHHFVTLVFPYTYLMYELYSPRLSLNAKRGVFGALVASFVLMASTSTEFGGWFADGHGHEIAQGYGMFLWAAVTLYVAVAWRLRVSQLELEPRASAAASATATGAGARPAVALREADCNVI